MEDYVDYIFIIPGNEFSLKFIISWSRTLDYLNNVGVSYKWCFTYHPNISVVRNTLFGFYFDRKDVSSQIDRTTPTVCKKFVMIDSDMFWKPHDLERLLSSPHSVTTGIYSYKDQKRAVIMKDNYEMYTYEELKDKKDYFEVSMSGLGFFSCDYEIVKSMSFPWFNSPYLNNEEYAMAEDKYFCSKIKDLGYKIYADPKLYVGHEKRIVLEPNKHV